MTAPMENAEIVRILSRLEAGLKEVRAELAADREERRADHKELSGQVITRPEFDAWRTAYDREIKDLKSQTAPVRVSMWQPAGVIIAAITGGVALVVTLL